jgi:L-ascorbate metabolism protein UlaG (beta-lactamase superfamily)
MHFIRTVILCFLAAPVAWSQTTSVQYLANEGVMVTHNATKVLFDPLFSNDFGQYQMVPTAMRNAILAGDAPYDQVDAVFISHHHEDHFSAADILQLLRTQTGARLYAPAQAVAAIRRIAGADDGTVLDRLVGLDLNYGDTPVNIETDDLLVEAVHIPHSGWPTARTDVQNIAFRITLTDGGTVLHLGDADPKLLHFANDREYWEGRSINLALPPYWFFASDGGNEILDDLLDVGHSIGIHVPDSFAAPANRPAELAGFELFTTPGEVRQF